MKSFPLRSDLVAGFFALIAALLMATSAGLSDRFELRWLDQQFQWLARYAPQVPQPADDAVVIVGIDDASLAEFGVPIATLHKQLGAFLEAMALARPKAVGLDLVLPERSYDTLQPGLDAALARGILTMRKTAPLIVGIGAYAEGKPRTIHPLFASLVGADHFGSVFVLQDIDGVVRRFDERLGAGGSSVPTLVGQLARATGVRTENGIIQFSRTVPIRYVPLNRVLDWWSQKDSITLQAQFGGKTVLLGSTLAHDDQHRVPLSASPISSGSSDHGVFVLGQQLRGQLAGQVVRTLPTAYGLIVSMLLLAIWWIHPKRWMLAAIMLALATLAVTSAYLLRTGWAIPAASWAMALTVAFLSRSALEAWRTATEKRRLRATFDGFVSPQVLQEILAGRLHPDLTGERRDVCVLFSDIRGFTTLSENMAPEAVTDLLNRYFERMARTIHASSGTLDKFIGDGIMAVFGAPKTSDTPCSDAFQAAREMIDEVQAFNREQLALGGPAIAIGIGLHFGPAFLGYIGSRERHEYSAIGNTVNTASRLESLTKDVGYPVVLSAEVAHRLLDQSAIENLGIHEVKGRAALEVFGWPAKRKG